MTPLSIAYVATAAICVLVAAQHVVVAFRVPERRLHLLFALAAFGVAGDAMVSRASYGAPDAERFLDLMPFGALFIVTTIVALSLYITMRTRAVRLWLMAVVAVLGALTVILDFAVGVAYIGEVELRRVDLPWGESIALLSGETNPLRLVADLTLIGFLLILLDTTVRLFRRGDRRAAWLIGGGLFVYSLGLFMIIPVDMGLILLPSFHTFAFLIIIAATSWDLTDELIRAARLSRKVKAGERRWRQLISDVQLLAARIDRKGRVVELNPHFEAVLGYGTDDVVGREYWTLVDPAQSDERRQAFAEAMTGNPTPEIEVRAVARDGSIKRIVWRNVMLRNSEGVIEGMLSIGADVTEQRAAEGERDGVLIELEATVKELESVKEKLEEENVYLKEEIGSRTEHGEILGSSDAVLYVLQKIRQVAATDATVLIQGETGVGKELVAIAIHNESERSDEPFLAVNCAALPSGLIESELFGHERGAFTGADRRRQGRFELADGGTLFLDEVAELPLDVQPKLLRALQEGTIERIGGTRTIEVDVRLIAATNRDLRAEVEAGRFREDLFYRLEVYPITVPPLRDRSEDIEGLVRHFAADLALRHRVEVTEVPPEVLRQLKNYDWPGNVRELQNVIERAVLNAPDGVLRLVSPLEAHNGREPRPRASGRSSLRTLDEVQRDHIAAVLSACGGQIAGRGGAASILGMHPNTLRSRLKKLGIRPPK
jgi:PAS domain S-box-containing protein